MAIEFEAKILDINPDLMEKVILHQGGVKVAERMMRRFVYDITPGDQSKWIRLRDTGTEVTLTVKEIKHDGIDGTHEVETQVGDFEDTNALLGALGFEAKGYQENQRVSYELEGAQLEVDSWPQIPPYLEIEATSKDEVIRVAELLGYHPADLTSINTTKVYALYNIDLASIPDLRF